MDFYPFFRIQPELDFKLSEASMMKKKVFATWLSPIAASLIFALSYAALWWLLMLVRYRRKIFIKV